ncbi:gamma-glutamylcyclotransferase family protein [Paenibacillus flagellatus]|uniref:Gamma-glutamylcyclotransferase n=1 Tax=Paenibacillus flagellatus TaxID=2211139 RepID=A0A2V5K366_9BACL|nr:gamma-glutamylcyclotransferase family protein [Paenibacillus flagellatus]PYI53102.1 gamma-glutamylcyclotransferase [Paenibacillus flagellatus]
MIRVFVYGTLLTGETNYGVAAPYVRSAEPGGVYGRLYDAGAYPALVLGEGGDEAGGAVVQGEWFTVDEEGLAAMDELEEYVGPGDPRNDYERVTVTDVDGVRTGWAYVWTGSRGFPEIRSGSWRAHRAAASERAGQTE